MKWTGSDDIDVSSYAIRLDVDTWKNVGENTKFKFSGLEDGEHTVTVKAVDGTGNIATTFITFVVKTSPIGGPDMMEERDFPLPFHDLNPY